LRLKVVAEGVETPAQLAFLQQHGCNEAQGYYFSKPVDAERFAEFLRAQHAGAATPAQTGARVIPIR
ncbi:MAG TPA: EAL domain-containing protein, partial [Burkholderiales bacterium]|nr:EAL domain-containing protein [Burkholderiales bacterium]